MIENILLASNFLVYFFRNVKSPEPKANIKKVAGSGTGATDWTWITSP